LYYAGYHTPFNYSIGVATEAEEGFTGRAFTKYGSNPILQPGSAGQWDEALVTNPWVIYDHDEHLWKMWYAGGNNAGELKIGYATAPTSFGSWTKHENNPVLSPNGSEIKFYNLSVLRESATSYKMLYNTDDPAGPSKIGLATSTDGIHWTKYSGNPVISGGGGGWMNASVFAPRTFRRVNGQYQIYFSGKQTTTGYSKNGIATSTDLINWSFSVSNPILESTRTWEAGTSSPGEIENPNFIEVGSNQYLFYDVWYSSPSRIGVVIIPTP
jgi:sucrose-6-phosphate hydrolase SacC (GH32 family)